MKTVLLSFILIFSYQFSSSQCVVNATNFGNNIAVPSYDILGDVSVTLNNNNTITLNLAANFMTGPGPDVRPYLVKSNGATNAAINTAVHNQTIDNVEHIAFNSIVNPSGMQSFTIPIPIGTSIEGYDKVLFYCLQFNQFWDIGSFTSFTNANCNLLSVDDYNLNTPFRIYPNPAKDYITIKNNKQLSLSISVFNILGKKVLKFEKSSDINVKLNVSSLKAGVYLLQTASTGVVNTNRFIKQ